MRVKATNRRWPLSTDDVTDLNWGVLEEKHTHQILKTYYQKKRKYLSNFVY